MSLYNLKINQRPPKPLIWNKLRCCA